MSTRSEATATMYALADAVRSLSQPEIVRCRSILQTCFSRRRGVAQLLRQSGRVLETLSALAEADDTECDKQL